jgi:DNA adenine methylase
MDFYRHFKGRVQFKSLDFQKARFHASEDVQVYLDPPYLPISKTASFAAYSENGFDLNDHKSLSKKCRQWSSRGCSVWLSNHAVPILKDIYPCASEYHYFMVPRVISQNTSSRLPVKEVLIQY